jgi:N-acetylneuraminic acid mutarotase
MSFYKLNPKITNVGPPGISNHSLTICGSKIVIFGGGDINGEFFNDVYIYDIKENTWTKPSSLNNIQRPEMRSRHSTHFLPPNQLLIYGGEQNGTVYDDMHVFNLDSNIWEKIEVFGQKPSPRFSFSHVNLGENLIMFIAGKKGKNILCP